MEFELEPELDLDFLSSLLELFDSELLLEPLLSLLLDLELLSSSDLADLLPDSEPDFLESELYDSLSLFFLEFLVALEFLDFFEYVFFDSFSDDELKLELLETPFDFVFFEFLEIFEFFLESDLFDFFLELLLFLSY